ncbi:MAG: NAD(P)-dependent oxidoreductase [Candidatus Heimdallarchaeaceae archaeon]
MTSYGPLNILFLWQPNERLKTYLEEGLKDYPSVNFILPSDLSEENLIELAPVADILMGWRPSLQLLKAAKKMKLFINPGAGVQHLIPLFRELIKEREVVLVNGHGNSYFTAQHAVALLLSLTNKILLHHNWMKNGRWRTSDRDAASIPLRNRTIGLLGYGAVNQKVHKFLSSFEVDFAILRKNWEKQKNPLPTTATKYSLDGLHRFLKDTDILIIALPLTSQTEGLIGDKELSLLGKNGLLVNVGRGKVLDERSLFESLQKKKIAGAAIDVWYDYQPEPDEKGRRFPYTYPFHELENIILSPHRGASPFSDLKRWDEQIENIKRFAEGRKDFLNKVNQEDGY